MALKKQILQDFFSVVEKSEPMHGNFEQPKEDVSKSILSSKKYTHFKIYDVPSERIHKNATEITQDKPRTNLRQTSDNSRTELKTNLGHNKIIHRTKLEQTSDNSRTKLKTNLGQMQTICSFSSLGGLQRKITLFIYEECKFAREKISPPLAIEHLSECCKTSVLSAQKTIQRLTKKEILLRKEFKNGRGGWTRYEIPHSIFQEILHIETNDKLRTNIGQMEDKPRTTILIFCLLCVHLTVCNGAVVDF